MTSSNPSWKTRLNSIQAGLAAGVVGTFLGWGLFGLSWAVANDSTFQYFYRYVWIGSQLYRDSILTASVLLRSSLTRMSLSLMQTKRLGKRGSRFGSHSS